MQAQATTQNQFINTIMLGNCIDVMRQMPANSVDFILTDPPYLVNYRDRSIQNDTNAGWLKPADERRRDQCETRSRPNADGAAVQEARNRPQVPAGSLQGAGSGPLQVPVQNIRP